MQIKHTRSNMCRFYKRCKNTHHIFPNQFFLLRLPFFPIHFFPFWTCIYSFEYVLIDNRVFNCFGSLVYIITFFVCFCCCYYVVELTHIFPKNQNESSNIVFMPISFDEFIRSDTKNGEREEKNVKKKKKKQACSTIGIFKRFAFNIQPHPFNNSFDCLSLNRQIIVTVTISSQLQLMSPNLTRRNIYKKRVCFLFFFFSVIISTYAHFS